MDNNAFETLKAQYEHPQPQKNPNHRTRYIILSIIGVLVIAAALVGVLILVHPKTTTAPAAKSNGASNGSTAVAFINTVQSNTTISNANANYWQYTQSSDQTASLDTSMIIKDDGYAFLTNVAPSAGVQFELKDDATSQKSAITSAIESELSKAGFQKVAQDVSTLSPYKVATYTAGETTCQLIDYNALLPKTEQSIYCADKNTIDTSYANVKTLLTKVDSSVASLAKTVVQFTATEDTKKLIGLTVQPNDGGKGTVYYFATLDNEYSYIGDRPVQQIDDAASFEISDMLKENLADPKWGTLLTDNIKQ